MRSPAAAKTTSRSSERAKAFPAALVIAAGVFAAYISCFRAPFVFDDGPAILGNASIRKLWPLWDAFAPPPGTTLSGRPIANLTLALNHALSGTDAWSYHALNLGIHILAALTLFGLARRTLMRPTLEERFRRDALPLAFSITLLWALHPLDTEAVTYVVQRVESLMGLFYLLTLYGFIRSIESPRPLGWQVVAVAACAIGMATKEVMATAPFMVLLYDRTFAAGTFRKAWRERRGLYLCLAATWLPLVLLVAGTGWSRHGSAGFASSVTPGSYWLTQFEALTRYLRLSLWPRPLVFDYGPYLISGPVEALPYVFVVLVLAAATWIGLRRKPALGFLGAWFFAILAPTSVVPVMTQTIAEHRMYLPVAAVMTLVVLGVYSAAGEGRRCWMPLGLLALGLGFLTARRNEIYGSELALWSDTVAKRPENARAHCSLGVVLTSIPGRLPEAITEFETAIRLHPNYSDAFNDLGIALEGVPGRLSDAIQQFEAAIRVRPDYPEAHNNLGLALARAGNFPEAIQNYREALRLRPAYPEAACNLGILLCSIGNLPEGISQLEAALRLQPDYARAHFFLANSLVQTGQIPEAIQHYEAAVRVEPEFAEASNNLGMILCRTGRTQEGIAHIEDAIRVQPDFVQAHFARGAALLQLGRKADATAEFEKVLQLRPGDPMAQRMLEMIRSAP